MSVKKIFITLITIVACVIIGAFVLNTLMPNVVETLIDATENMIFRATGLKFNFNANNTTVDAKTEFKGANTDTTVTGTVGNNVTGFGGGEKKS